MQDRLDASSGRSLAAMPLLGQQTPSPGGLCRLLASNEMQTNQCNCMYVSI